jgi:archaellum component FlaF (FlaF/FlaG flagellin family)
MGSVLLLALLVGALSWFSRVAETEYEILSEVESADGRHILTVRTGNPLLPYGPHQVLITLTDVSGPTVIATHQTRLANDGMGIDENNISTLWVDAETVRICMRGDEQKDALILVDVPGRKITEREEKCREMA